ncbi:MAG: DeoR/GlpR family DNA-binding transcription regulator [Actinomycetota bacterium]|nr:DeoR/GlpR family DNA-binding transcription regulator [Actinomycetota bacterium]
MATRATRLPARRKDELAAYVAEVGEVTVNDLAEHFGVSVDTVRRDLDELAVDGRVKRTHGGAVRSSPLSRMETSFTERMGVQDAAKNAIGEAAARLIEDGQTILLNGGTTALAVLPHLARRRNLTLVTNNLWAPGKVPPECARDVYLLGGTVRLTSQVTVGPVEFAGTSGSRSHRIHADIALISVGGIASGLGYSTSNLQEARMMYEMMQSSRQVVVLADHSKFGRSTFAQVADLDVADILVTDSPLEERMAEALSTAEVKVVLAGESASRD